MLFYFVSFINQLNVFVGMLSIAYQRPVAYFVQWTGYAMMNDNNNKSFYAVDF